MFCLSKNNIIIFFFWCKKEEMTSVNCRHLWLCATSRSSSDVEVKIEVVNARLVTVLFLYNDDLEKCIVEN